MAFSGHLLGNREGFLVRTAEVSRLSRGQFRGRQQPGGCAQRAVPLDPLRLQRVAPGTFERQETRPDTEAVALLVAALLGRSPPGPHRVAAVPRSLIPPQP